MNAIQGLQIAIDGPSASGKGTIAAMVGEQTGLPVLDTGLLYRFAGWRAAASNITLNDGATVAALLEKETDQLAWLPSGIIQFAGRDCTSELRGEHAGAAASVVAAQPAVRNALLTLQRQLAQAGCVMDGRDIGSVVLPKAQAKFFLTASRRERARRRWLQLKNSEHAMPLEVVDADLLQRDKRDAERNAAPLVAAADAITIDSTTIRADQVIDRIMAVLERRKLLSA
ncbi:MAG: (d)CMP kinase [Mariprofundales bacterium]